MDVGCGPATGLQDAAELAGPDGLVVGLDSDRQMLAAATGGPRSAGVALVAADAHRLPLRAHCIDRLRTDRALQHMNHPRLVLREFRRVLAFGGIAVLAEPDWRTLAIDGGDPQSAARCVDYTCGRVVRNASVGREVARLGRDAGFLVRNAYPASQAGYLTEDQADEWLTVLQRGPILAAVSLFVTTLAIPE